MELVKNNRVYSLLGQRGTFGTVLTEMAESNDRIVAISADLTRVSGLEKFSEKYPERFYNIGIAEENLIGFAAGFADAGKIPFATTFANFAALRANEFVRHFMAYMKCNVKLVGLGSGFAMELFGTTHYALEDVAVLRSMPNLTILSPCDCMETAKCVLEAIDIDGPVYIRLSGRMNNPIVNKADYEFQVGKAIELRQGTDAVIYATGSMVSVALKAAKILEKEDIFVKVVNIHTIKPIDRDIIVDNKDMPFIVSIEEHSKDGGMGSAIAEVLSEQKTHGRLMRMGTCDRYLMAGQYEYMLEQHGLTAENLAKAVKENI